MGHFPFEPANSSVVTILTPSGDTTGATDAGNINTAVAALPAHGGTVQLAAGNWYLVPGAVVINQTAAIFLQGPSDYSAIINAVSGTAGDVIRMYNPTSNGTATNPVYGGGVTGVTIDGTNATAGSAGLHIGDMEGASVDLLVQHFNGAGSIGCHIDNTLWWTEKLSGQVYAYDNTKNIVFDVTGTGAAVTNSFGYSDTLFRIRANAGQDGVVFQGGAYYYNGSLRIRGNFGPAASVSSAACLRLTGTAAHGVNAGAYSHLYAVNLDVQVEADGTGTGYPQTINCNSVNNIIDLCRGILNFQVGSSQWTAANQYGTSQFATGVISFSGVILGDSNLASVSGGGVPAAGQPVLYGQAFQSSGELAFSAGDFFYFVLAANTTIAPAGFANTASGPQRKTILIQQAASGGPFTVTWPHPGSGTNASPKVVWAAGSAPTMTATANALDMYELSSIDGATWIGRATQNVS